MADIAAVQRFWDRQPCNIRHSPLEVGTLEYFEEVARRRYYVESHIRPFAEFSSWKGKRVLDIGCGIGTDTVSFALDGAEVIAIDVSPRSLEIAKQHASAFGVEDRIEFHCGDAERLTLKCEPFDLIWCWGVLHHMISPELAIDRMWRWGKPGTVLKVMLYHRWSHKSLLVWLGLMRAEAQAGVPILRTCTKNRAVKLLQPFTVKEMFVDHIFPWRIKDYVNYRYVKARPWRWFSPEAFRWLERHFGQHLCITAERVSRKTVIDCWRILDKDAIEKAGAKYVATGVADVTSRQHDDF